MKTRKIISRVLYVLSANENEFPEFARKLRFWLRLATLIGCILVIIHFRWKFF